ncbi:MAG: hypothetical protein JNM31_06460 [Flavobacteriales bacterium]|nr:hypothetical protein [Flavobacteriales bacterium]
MSFAHSPWLIALCLLAGAAYAIGLYAAQRSRKDWGPIVHLVLAMARGVAVAFLAFLLLEPMVRNWEREVRKPIVVVAHDGSGSLVAAGDTAWLRGPYRTALEELTTRLSNRFDVRSYTYGSRVRDGLSFDQSDPLTDVDELLREVQDRHAGPELGAVILDGDGIFNRGRDPRLAAAQLGVPVHAVLLGDTTVHPDLVLRRVDHNRIAFLGNEFPLVAHVAARHLTGARSRVVVEQDGQELAAADLTVAGMAQFAEVPFLVKARRPGLQRFTVRVVPVTGEATVTNNAMSAYVQVLDDRRKVLILAHAPHPDVAAIRSALADLEGYTVEFNTAADYTGNLDDVDLLVLHQLPSSRHTLDAVLTKATARRVPLLMILGGLTDLARFNAMDIGFNFASGGQRTHTDAQAFTALSFGLFRLAPETERAIERMPPLQVPFGQLSAGGGASILFGQRVGAVRTSYPLVAVDRQGERHVGLVAGEGVWRWRLADQLQNGSTAHFDGFLRKLVQFLALKAEERRFRVDHATEFQENEVVQLGAELYDPAFALINTPDVDLVLKDEEGRERELTFSRTTDAYRLSLAGLAAGRYSYTARTDLGKEHFTATGEFLVNEMAMERMNTVADHSVLTDMAVRTGGTAVRPGELGRIADELEQRKDLVARSYAHVAFTDLVDLRWPFFILLALLTLEWGLRRWHGSY